MYVCNVYVSRPIFMYCRKLHTIHVHTQVAKRASTAAAPLAAWVKANVTYSAVLEKINPLEQEQASLAKYKT